MKSDSARDKAMDKLIAARLRARLNAGGADCPEVEILAAFVERALTPRERASFENHLAGCARCQQSVAELVRLSEADVAASCGDPTPCFGARQALSRPARMFAFRWAWAGTALAAMLVAAIWVTDEYQTGLRQREASKAPSTAQTRKQPAAPPIPSGEAVGSTPSLRSGQAPGSASGPGQPVAAKSGAPTQRQRSPQGTSAEAARAPKPSPAREMSDLAVRSSPSRVAPLAIGHQFSSPTSKASAAVARNPVALGAGEGGGIGAKAEGAPAPPPPPPPAAQLAAQPVREATRPETEAQAKERKTAQSIPSARRVTQQLFGTVSGTVTDASGAAVPSAIITVRNTSTDVATVLAANNSGAYLATGLNPGVYKVQANAQGFKPSAANDVALRADANRKVDFVLQVGATTQTVEVTAESPAVQPEQSNLGRTVKQRSVDKLTTLRSAGRNAATVQTPQSAWRVGPRGLILEAGADGKWKKHQSGVKRDLFGISFSSPSVGWVVGERGTILRTTDGGNTWLKMPSPTDEDLTHVTATNALTASVTTRGGVNYTTTDSGRTWSQTTGIRN